MKRYLVLENGKVFEGEAFGAQKEAIAEIVFTTAMTGYIETLTDQSYKGQAVLQTFPLMGNYGIISQDREGERVGASAYIVNEECEQPSNFRCETTLDSFLKNEGIPGLKGIDTRALTKILRDKGTMNGMITDDLKNADIEKIRSYRIVKPVDEVSVKEETVYEAEGEKLYRVALFDYGIKKNIIRCLTKRGCEVTLLPHDTPASRVRELAPDGLFLSNGPGDPTDNPVVIKNLRQILDETSLPILGICLGHQLMALAAGAQTFKMKYGHRGHNQPVIVPGTQKCFITSQNHGFAVDPSTLPSDWEAMFTNLNDGTNEGIRHKSKPFFSTQFHPEASSGPVDTESLFAAFADNMVKYKEGQSNG